MKSMSASWKKTVGLLVVWAGSMNLLGAAEPAATPDGKMPSEWVAAGKNRAVVQVERQLYSAPLNIDYLVNTLAKHGSTIRVPLEPEYLYQTIDPVPLQSYKIFTPWLNHFKESMVFVIGKLDPGRIKIARWSVNLYDASGKPIKHFTGIGQPPSAFYWNGRDDNHNPVTVGQTYIPEIILEDYYGIKVNLPQKGFELDQFVWTAPRQLRTGALLSAVFQERSAIISADGRGILRELSYLISQMDAVLLEIECQGSGAELAAERAQALKKYFTRENLKLRRIDIAEPGGTAEEVFYLRANKIYTR